MNKSIKIMKINNYDKFKCIADKCKFTCCSGWDVSIDDNTYFKLKEDKNLDYITNKIVRCSDRNEYFIDKDIHEECPFLDRNGLCNIVKEHGDEYLSLTCQSFPRIENVFSDRRELSLSCACPEVVDMISEIDGNLLLDISDSNVIELKIREILINIINKEGSTLDNKLIKAFDLLMQILENEEIIDESSSRIEKFLDNHVENFFNETKFNKKEALEEINNLFLDITENYRVVPSLENELSAIYDYAENIDLDFFAAKWDEFKEEFNKYNKLIEKFIIVKIYSNCVNEDKVEMVISFQNIMLEFILMRYAVFLKYLLSEDKIVKAEDIKDYIVIFSRVIGNNAEAVNEFIEDGFGYSILELGYLYFIAMF